MVKWQSLVITWLSLVGLTQCTSPGVKIYEQANQLGLSNGVVHGKMFTHAVFFRHFDKLSASKEVHVYIEGDGRPFLNPKLVSKNPTPKNPLAMKLMARDNRPSVYVGRPCYFGFTETAPCSPKYWTTHRYAREVVDSMAAAVRGVLSGHLRNKKLVFIGYSGGGPLAMLLASRFRQTRAVVTVAGNIDVGAWVDHHKYSPIPASLNPAYLPVLDSRVFQLHLAGQNDTNVPPEIIQPEVERQTKGDVTVYPNFDHVCCWVRVWPDILQRYGFSWEGRNRN